MKPIYLLFIDSEETPDVRLATYRNISDPVGDHLSSIIIEVKNELQVTDV